MVHGVLAHLNHESEVFVDLGEEKHSRKKQRCGHREKKLSQEEGLVL